MKLQKKELKKVETDQKKSFYFSTKKTCYL